MFGIKKVNEPLVFCSKCGLQTGHIINFGKSVHCWSCRSYYDLDNQRTSNQRTLVNV